MEHIQESPAPYDWHPAEKFTPPLEEPVIVHELFPGWACYTTSGWFALDICGNRSRLQWQPKLWRRQYIPVAPSESGAVR